MHEVESLRLARETYERERVVFIPGDIIVKLLKSIGLRESEISALGSVSETLISDPTLEFRKSRNARFAWSDDLPFLDRLPHQGFMLSKSEDFVRSDSDQVRTFDPVQDDLGESKALVGLFAIKRALTSGIGTARREGLDYDSTTWVTTLFHLRTLTTPELLGEPALEGVHTDGVDHTMTTLLGHKNMETTRSAITSIHEMDETTGIRTIDADPSKVLGMYQHRNFLDTMIIADNERKHSLTPLFPDDSDAPASRDMLIFFTRRPTLHGHPSHHLDSTQREPDRSSTILPHLCGESR